MELQGEENQGLYFEQRFYGLNPHSDRCY